ncbi:hypothetical protein EUTSA_v10027902mg [Eutrema salsugineum]|uniref:Uncharacterized protein n=1 Tax=Eutrema salsugineum TaxID=72664 RepID=V4LXS9_EUTSA|nr:uncharacterized protein LOC18022813 [Eutrema salsugineum]ESQ47332.1 hypothetical protein EUTSA_v10027902mg [Eutrema salsugineum]
MPRRKAKRGVKRTEEEKNHDEDDKCDKGIQREEKEEDFVDEEVERQIAAIRAIRDVEIEHTLTSLRLLESCFTEEQLDTPVLEFFKENFPDLSINEVNGEIEMKWIDKNGGSSFMGKADDVDMNYSILKRLSMGFPDLYSNRPSLGGYDLPYNVRASMLGTENIQLENLVFQGTSNNQMLASHDALRTPEVNGQRLSFGMTPKTRRQPKPGEMMLSVHGSPLGVYKEDDNLGAINEENS